VGFKKEYILFLYLGTFLPALLASLVTRRIPRRKEIQVGIGMGTAGVGGTFFFLLALEKLTGTVAFPLRTCGGLLLTIFLSFLLWGERLNKKEMFGLFLAITAIILMSL
jgi:drug/metabolite transporter (DMT)-like permease